MLLRPRACLVHTLVLVAVTGVFAAAPAAPIDRPAAAACFAQVRRLSEEDGGRLWGVPLNGPLLFVEPASMEAVANQPDREGRLSRAGDVWTGKLPERVTPANSALDWAGVRWTMVLWPLPELEHARGRLLMHECFHRLQDRLGLPAANPNNAHLDDRDGRIWMRLEMRALAEALSHSGEERRRAAADALAFRGRRAALCGAPAAESERQLELNEGLAEYTGLVLSGYGKPSWETRAAVRLEQEQANAAFARSFAYATGPAYGLLLDSYGVAWRKGLSPAASLPTLLRKAIGPPHPSGENVEARAGRYGGAQVITFETEQAGRREQKIAAFRKAFVEGPTLTLPVASGFNFSFDPGSVESFPGAGQVFGSAKVTDEWGVLQVQSGGVLMKRPAASFTGVVLRAPANPTGDRITGEGWTLQLNPGWKLAPGARSRDWTVVRSDQSR
jgi:hypothetical protein